MGNKNILTRIVSVDLTIIEENVSDDFSNVQSDEDLKKSIRVRAKNLLGVDDVKVNKVRSFMSIRTRKKKGDDVNGATDITGSGQ